MTVPLSPALLRPNMQAACDAHHESEFQILGISFDQENMEEKVTEFLKERELPWPQVYEGKGWNTSLGRMHDVSAIPFVLLVDGDIGEILADARQLRGEKLSDFIAEQLEKKKGSQEQASAFSREYSLQDERIFRAGSVGPCPFLLLQRSLRVGLPASNGNRPRSRCERLSPERYIIWTGRNGSLPIVSRPGYS